MKMLTAYQLQAASGFKGETPPSSSLSSPAKLVIPPLNLKVALEGEFYNDSSKQTIESQQTKKETFDVACHEIRNFLFGIAGMTNLLIKNNGILNDLVASENGKKIEPAFRKQILDGIVGAKNRIEIMHALARGQKEIVNTLLGSPRDQGEKTCAESTITSQRSAEKTIQLLKAKFGIAGLIHELKKAHVHLETLLLSAEGQKLEIVLKKEMLDLIEADKRSIYILDLCVEGQDGLVDGLGVSDSPSHKKTTSLIQPKKIIAEVAEILKEKLEDKQLKLELNISQTDDVSVYGNSADLRRILINLVSNAIKFTTNTQNKQGIIKIGLTDPIINSSDTILTFFVEDNGIGIKKSEQSGLFKSYQQANSQIVKLHGGNGLGLSTTKKLIESMGGEIHCISAENVGSNFIFKVKCPNARPAGSTSPLIFSKSLPTDINKHVLIVDDHAVNRRLLQVFLQKAGYTYDVAKNGKEAIELCENNKFDLILMDINMPVLDGLEATKIIRQSIKTQRNQKTPIIGLSADEDTASLERANNAGMDDYLIKGSAFNQLSLLKKIKCLCSEDANISPMNTVKISPL